MCIYYIHRYTCRHTETILAEHCAYNRLPSHRSRTTVKPCAPSSSKSRATLVDLIEECDLCQAERLREEHDQDLADLRGGGSDGDEESEAPDHPEPSPFEFVMEGLDDKRPGAAVIVRGASAGGSKRAEGKAAGKKGGVIKGSSPIPIPGAVNRFTKMAMEADGVRVEVKVGRRGVRR